MSPTRSRVVLATFVAVFTAVTGVQAAAPGTCISEDERALMQQINEYRNSHGLPDVPVSPTLVTVAQHHVHDAIAHGSEIFAGECNLHSWSNHNPSLWTGMCYTPDHAEASRMWSKPREISQGVFTGNGYENAAAGYPNVTAALNGWIGSSGHNAVMLNEGIWSSITWRSMGVGVGERYYFLWFSDRADTAAEMPECDAPFFKDGFEPPP